LDKTVVKGLGVKQKENQIWLHLPGEEMQAWRQGKSKTGLKVLGQRKNRHL
jgi:hypothetical protein